MRKKGKGDKVGDLRTINLMEVELNFNNKVMARDLLQCVEENNLLPAEHYGSRNGHYSAKLAVNKKFLFDLALLSHMPLTICRNDAKSCFDWTVHSVLSLEIQRMGMPLEPLTSMFATIQHMNYVVRKAFGYSDAPSIDVHWINYIKSS